MGPPESIQITPTTFELMGYEEWRYPASWIAPSPISIYINPISGLVDYIDCSEDIRGKKDPAVAEAYSKGKTGTRTRNSQ